MVFEYRRLPMTSDSDFLLRTPLEDRVGKEFGAARMGFLLD
jgi:hypothetical protein